MIAAISCFIYVREALEQAAATNEPEVYVHYPSFQVISFVLVFGLPLLILLGVIIFAAKKIAERSKYSPTIQPAGLVAVLLDREAPFGDRHDAAMDLAKYSEPEAWKALTSIKNDPKEDPDIVEETEQSLLEIRRRRDES